MKALRNSFLAFRLLSSRLCFPASAQSCSIDGLTIAPGGPTHPIVVIAAPPARFYLLRQP
jgi:hypothetical protein